MSGISGDLNLLVALQALLEERTVTRAAAKLNMSQPAMSNVLARMRHAYGDPLFIRVGSRMEPTPFALALAEPVSQALGILREGIERVTGFDPSKSSRRFTLLMPDIGVALILPRLVQHLSQVAPDVVLHTPQVSPLEYAERLQDGRADLAMQGLTALLPQRVYQRKLWKHDWVCIARRNHPLLHAGLSLQSYAACRHIHVQSGGSSIGVIESMLKKSGLKRRIALEVSSYLGLAPLVSGTDYLVTVSSTIAACLAESGGIDIHPLPFEFASTPIHLFWHERSHHDAGGIWLRGVMVDLFSRTDPRPEAPVLG